MLFFEGFVIIIAMKWLKQIRGPYLYYMLDTEFMASHVMEQTPILHEDLKHNTMDVALDLRKLKRIDSLGVRFIVNLSESLQKEGKRMVFVGGDAEIIAMLNEKKPIKIYHTVADFELEFHGMDPKVMASILQLAQGSRGLKTLKLVCPLCGNMEVSGFVLDEAHYDLTWSERTIPPLWKPKNDSVDAIDFDLYKVAVCPQCFFASARPDFFTIRFPEGEVKSRLKAVWIENLKMHSNARVQLVNQEREMDRSDFFLPPRDMRAGYLSWVLHEFCQKNMYQDRHMIDAFELVMANLAMCKFAKNEREIDDHLHTALAWINNLMQYQTQYSTQRIMEAYTYQVSLLLAFDKNSEARKVHENFLELYGEEEGSKFWIDRSQLLIDESF